MKAQKVAQYEETKFRGGKPAEESDADENVSDDSEETNPCPSQSKEARTNGSSSSSVMGSTNKVVNGSLLKNNYMSQDGENMP